MSTFIYIFLNNNITFSINKYLLLIFLIVFFSFLIYTKLNNKNSKKIEKLIFKSENKKDTFSIHINKLLYLKASGNYTEIHFLSDELHRSYLLRSTLKSIEKEYQNILFRCHRSYLINPNIDATIIKKNKNIILDIGYKQIPVSQSYQDNFSLT